MADNGSIYLLPVTMTDNGNPADVLTARELELIPRLRHFVVENVRTARRFLKRVDRDIDIDSLTLVELNEHTDPADVPAMLGPVLGGADLGIMSEAGCPAVADPGALLVAAAQRRGIKVVPMVGPSSILLSLMASGMNGQNFTFNGYLPIDDHARDARLRELANTAARRDVTQIFIETPYRNNRLIERMCAILPPDLRLCVASDITGPAESVVTRTISQWRTAKYDYNKIPTIFLLGR